MRSVRIGPVVILEVANTLMRALRDGLRPLYAVHHELYTAVPHYLFRANGGIRNEGAAELHFNYICIAPRRRLCPHPPLGYANHHC
jgi:hypothetical protein